MDARQLIAEALAVADDDQRAAINARLNHADQGMRALTEPTKICLWGEEIAEEEGWSAEGNWWYFARPINADEELLAESVGLIYPVLNPVGGKQIAEITHIARDHDVAASQSHCRNHHISVPLSRTHAGRDRRSFTRGQDQLPTPAISPPTARLSAKPLPSLFAPLQRAGAPAQLG